MNIETLQAPKVSNGHALLEFVNTLRSKGYTDEQVALLLNAQIRVVPSPDGAPLLVSSKVALNQDQVTLLARLIRRYQTTGPIVYIPPDVTPDVALSKHTTLALAIQLYTACRSDDLSNVAWEDLTVECRASWLVKAKRFDMVAVFSDKIGTENVFTLTR